MIPKKLTKQGFLSYKNEITIDFDYLTKENVFGIFGPIGAGKSAILDAICYALFDENYRNLNKNDLIHLECKKAKISFEFEHNNIIYRVDKEISNNKKALLYKNNELIVEGVTEVKNKIIEILKLNYDKFTKTVIIPQGTYQELLKNEDYYGLLKDYLGIPEIVIPEKIKTYKNYIQNLLEKKEIELSNYQNITQEKIDEYQINAEKYNALVKKLTEEKKLLDSEFQEKKLLYDDFKIYHKILEEEKNHLLNSEKIAAFESEVKVYKEFNELFTQRKQIFSNYQRTQKNLQDSQSQLEKEKYEFNNTQNFITQLNEKKPHIEKLKTQKEENEQDLKTLIKVIFLQNQIQDFQNEIRNIEIQILQAEKIYSEKQTRLTELEKETEALISENEKVDFVSINSLNVYLPEIIKLENKKKESEGSLEKLKLEITQNLDLQGFNEIEKINETLNLLKQEAEIHFKLSELSLDLKDGTPCPLCGSTTHPRKLEVENRNFIKERIEKYQNYIDDLQKNSIKFNNDLDLFENELNKLESYPILTSFPDLQEALLFIQNTYNQYTNREKIIKDNQKKIANLKEEIAKNPMESYQKVIGSHLQNIENNSQTIQNEVVKLNTSFPEINEQVKQKLENQIKSLKSEIENFEKEFNDVSKKLDVTQTKIKNFESNIEKYTEELQNFEKQKDECEFKIQSKVVQLDLVQETAENFIKEILEKYDSKQIEKLERVVNEYHSKTIQIQTQKAEYEKKIAGRTPVDESELKDISQKLVELESQITAKTKEKNEYNFLKENYEKQLKEKIKLEEEWNVLKRKKLIVDEFSKNTRADEFKNFIVDLYLEDFIQLVNKNLKKLNQGEFELVKVLEKNKPIMKVIDHRNGSQLRTINSLSGGQSFLAAFSMGLSISEQLKTGNEKSFFFIDEGFGSLDNDTLQLMKQLIFQLRNENRIIGIISHIEELKECITQKICLEKSKNGVNISYM